MTEEVFVFPPSFGQQRLWFLDQLTPGSTVYNIPTVIVLRKRLDLAVLQRAFDEIVRRHEVLRTSFDIYDEELMQVVAPDVSLPLSLVDLRGLEPADRPAEALRLATDEAQRPFDLSRGPLLRVLVLRMDEQEQVILLTMHHIITDGWSMDLLGKELIALYDAFSQGRPSPLAELPIQYADFAIWQRDWLQGDVLDQKVAYWKRQLQDLTALELPTDHPRPAQQSYRGATHSFVLPQSLWSQLQRLSQQHGATTFMTLLAAFQVLLMRYSGQEDVAVGTAIAGRNRAEVEHLIGFFVNSLVLRTDLSGNPTFTEVLKRVRAVCLGAYEWQDVPFEKLVDEIQTERDLSRSPLFQVMFLLQNTPGKTGKRRPTTAKVVELQQSVARYDLSLSITEYDDGLDALIEYSTDLFEAATIERMVAHFETLLREIVADAERPIAELPLLTAREEDQLLIGWNNTDLAFPSHKCLHEMFEEQVLNRPEDVALVYADAEVSYQELNRRANKLAHYLRGLGVGPEVIVGVFMERSLEMMVGILAILKAGGAYLPLDPGYPRERLAFMLDDAGVGVLLTQAHLRQALPAHPASVICLDAEWERIEAESAENPDTVMCSDALAYTIYTSGSTGRPKGVMVTQRNVVNFFAAMSDRFSTENKGAAWLALTSISFDISVLELLWTLTRGFKVVIQSEQQGSHYNKEAKARREAARKGMQFSLFYFASNRATFEEDRYRLLLEGARFADEHDFTAVWTPERHFHAFGDLYPNPAVTGAAIASITKKVQIRAGSVVLPLHHPIRVAEDWAVIDNISRGRVGLSFASGWHADDFVFAPERYADRRGGLAEQIEQVRQLWRGETLKFTNGHGKEAEVRILPRPVQPELPVWITSSGSPDTFIAAGKMGARLLTHLLGQSVEQLGEKIELYRRALREAGHVEKAGHVTLMLHTFVGQDLEQVREKVRRPFKDYLMSSIDLLRGLGKSLGINPTTNGFTDDDKEALLEFAFNRYFTDNGLIGTPESCLKMIERLKAVGVDEVACLIDFGVDDQSVLNSLPYLNEVRILSNQVRESPQEEEDYSIAAQLKRQAITHLQCTPSMANILSLDEETLSAMRSLEKLLLGGEALPASLVARLRESYGGEIYNMYGPTETTIWSAMHMVCDEEQRVPIGKPIANTQIYILDHKARPVPIGVAGEVYIGGEGVVRGYLDQPALSAEKFVPHPYGREPGARLYRTGDMARYLADGNIEFLGRVDEQVKVRGHRIELGEIEAALTQHAGIREAVVAALEDPAGLDKQLVAYLVGADQSTPTGIELQNYLRQRLPEQMIPGVWVMLDALPRTPNGKINRAALPAPELSRPELACEYVAPRTLTEEMLVSIWQEVLHVAQIGIHDNFFELGGHSLRATQVIMRVQNIFHVQTGLRRLFEAPTVAGLASIVEADQLAAAGIRPPSISRASRDGLLPLSFQQEAMLGSEQESLDMLFSDPSLHMSRNFGMRGRLNLATLEASFTEIIRRHESLRTVFVKDAEVFVQLIGEPKDFKLDVKDLSHLATEERWAEVQRIAEEEHHKSFDPRDRLLLRAVALRLAEQEHIILITLHHVVGDGWSTALLVNELATVYSALSEGQPSPLKELQIQYADYAAWQRQWLQGDVLESLVSYWKRQLGDAPAMMSLPLDRPRKAGRIMHNGWQQLNLSKELADKLQALSQREGVTLFMTLLGAFKALLVQYSGQQDVVVSSAIANRNQSEVEGLIGLFTQPFVLRTDLSGDPSFREALWRVRDVALEAYKHQDLPFNLMLKALGRDPNSIQLSLTQVCFALQTAVGRPFELPGLSTVPLSFSEHEIASMSDLELVMTETERSLFGVMRYNADVFEAATIKEILGRYEYILECVVENPALSLSALTKAETSQMEAGASM
jgi:natural product biosynthesis luciferase-like monooxygenase protein